MQIKCKSVRRTSIISYQPGNYKTDRLKGSGRNLNELNEFLWAGESEKQEKQWFPLPVCLSRKITIEKKNKYGQNTNQTEHSSS